MISAAESIVQNIVEGCGAATPREFARYLDISIKSSTELEGGFDLARRYEILSATKCSAGSVNTIDLRRKLYSLRRKVIDSLDDRHLDADMIRRGPSVTRGRATRHA
jgi:four helix bundle protein